MEYTPAQAQLVLQTLSDQLARQEEPVLSCKKMLWIMVFMRCRVLTQMLSHLCDATVLAGPFKGMKLTPDALHAYNSCILLGTYEHELHDVIERVIASHYTRILNIGCSVGYYAVGLALRMPHMIIDAFDTDPEARRKCAEMAVLNGVQDRVRISGEFRPQDFASSADEKTLALVDIEGAELDLLDPATVLSLREIDVIVEMHDILMPGLSSILVERFALSHHINVIANQTILPDLKLLPESFPSVDAFDHLLLGWEGRDGPTPWGIFHAKA